MPINVMILEVQLDRVYNLPATRILISGYKERGDAGCIAFAKQKSFI